MRAVMPVVDRICPIVTVLSALASGHAIAQAQCPPHYSVQMMSGPTNCSLGLTSPIYPNGLNNKGESCGFYILCALGPYVAYTSIDAQTVTPIQVPPGVTYSEAWDITDAGVIVGNLDFAYAFLLDDKGFQMLGIPPGGNLSVANAVNSSNVVVGHWGNNITGPGPVAFRWENGVIEDLGSDLLGVNSIAHDINEMGAITGWMNQTSYPPDYHAFVWENGRVTDLGLPFPDAFASEGYAINNTNQVCGVWFLQSNDPPYYDIRGFHWDGAEFTELGTLEGYPRTSAYDLNDEGVIVGVAHGAQTDSVGIVWHDRIMYDLNDLITPVDGLFIHGAAKVNQKGQILCSGSMNVKLGVAVLLTPVPPVLGDMDCDAIVNVNDLIGVINAWGTCKDGAFCAGDFNEDRVVSALDIVIVLENWS